MGLKYVSAAMALSFAIAMPALTHAIPQTTRDARDVALDKAASERRHKLQDVLSSDAKRKLGESTEELLNRLARSADERDPQALAASIIRPRFPGATAKQMNVLTFFVLADAADATTNRDMLDKRVAVETKSGTHDLTKEQIDHLMAIMDRQSAFDRGLRSALDKIASVPDSIVRDLK